MCRSTSGLADPPSGSPHTSSTCEPNSRSASLIIAREIQPLADRLAAFNDLLKPSGTEVTAEEYTLLSGPVLARVFFDRAEVTDEFIAPAVEHWLAAAPEKPA